MKLIVGVVMLILTLFENSSEARPWSRKLPSFAHDLHKRYKKGYLLFLLIVFD